MSVYLHCLAMLHFSITDYSLLRAAQVIVRYKFIGDLNLRKDIFPCDFKTCQTQTKALFLFAQLWFSIHGSLILVKFVSLEL